MVKGVGGAAPAGRLGDELDGLHDPAHDFMLDAAVLALRVLPDEDRVDVVKGGLVALDGDAGTDVGVQVKGAAEGEVQGDVPLADGRGQGACGGMIWEVRELGLQTKTRNTTRNSSNTPSSPFRATLLRLMEWRAVGGMQVLPSTSTGVTSTSSHAMGTCGMRVGVRVCVCVGDGMCEGYHSSISSR
jgi:hypothetical protein